MEGRSTCGPIALEANETTTIGGSPGPLTPAATGFRSGPSGSGMPWHEIGPIRPPNEGGDRSLLLRLTRNCPWNRCTFCATYKGKRFSFRTIEEIKADIDAVRVTADALKRESWRLGLGGKVTSEVLRLLIRRHPESYNAEGEWTDLAARRLDSLVNVAGWLSSGAKTVFLQDANSPQMAAADMAEVLTYLKKTFDGIERITSYARSKTVARKPLHDLVAIREAGLSRFHIGVESGSDEVLRLVEKGVAAHEHVVAGKKAKNAGIEVCAYVMPGLGGRELSQKHALETAQVLNEMQPDFVRLRTLVLRKGTPLREKFLEGEFHPLSEDEAVAEIGLLIENLKCRCYLASDQVCNLLPEVQGYLPEDKPRMLEVISKYLDTPPLERLAFQLRRRAASYIALLGEPDDNLALLIEEAAQAIAGGHPDAPAKVDAALDAMKQAFI